MKSFNNYYKDKFFLKYATNIKQEKLKDCEELIENKGKSDIEKLNELKKLKRLRLESFMLNPPSKLSTDMNFKNSLNELNEQNNNYLGEKTSNHKLENADHNLFATHKQRGRTLSDLRRNFQLGDIIDFVHNGLESIIDDDVTKRFTTEELTVWNLLSRTNQQYEYVSFRVTILWLIGFIVRYCLLFPAR